MSEFKIDEYGDPVFVKLKYKHKTLAELVKNTRSNAEIVHRATLIMRGRRYNDLVEDMICDVKDETERIRTGLDKLKSTMGGAKSTFEACEKRMCDMDDLMERMLRLIKLKQGEQARAMTSSQQGMVGRNAAQMDKGKEIKLGVIPKHPAVTNPLNGTISKTNVKAKCPAVTDPSKGAISKTNVKGISSMKPKKKEVPAIRKVAFLTEEEFSKIPKYITRALTIEIVNGFIDKFNQALEEKYRVLRLPFTQLTQKEIDRRNKLRSEEIPNAKDLIFITEEDFSFTTRKNLSKSDSNIIAALRQAQRVKKEFSRELLRYIVM